MRRRKRGSVCTQGTCPRVRRRSASPLSSACGRCCSTTFRDQRSEIDVLDLHREPSARDLRLVQERLDEPGEPRRGEAAAAQDLALVLVERVLGVADESLRAGGAAS